MVDEKKMGQVKFTIEKAKSLMAFGSTGQEEKLSTVGEISNVTHPEVNECRLWLGDFEGKKASFC